MGETGIPEQPWRARLAPSSCAEIRGARVHVRPCAAPLPCVLPAAPRHVCSMEVPLSVRPFLTALQPSLLSPVHVCALLSSHGSAQATVTKLLGFSPLQTVPPAKVDGGLPAASLVRGEQLPAVLPVSPLSALR